MMPRRIIRRRRFGTRRKRKVQWVRYKSYVASPTSPYTLDLLSDYRSQFGITFNPQDLVVVRLHIKVSAIMTFASLAADSGALFAIFNESLVSGSPTALTQQYAERYLMWDHLYINDSIKQGGPSANPVLYQEYDIRAKRKLQNQDETFFAQLVSVGNTPTFTSVSMSYSMLIQTT